MLERIKAIDTDVFLWFNGWHNSFWDAVMYGITFKFTWFPFYVVIIYLLARQYRWQAAWMVLAIAAMITLADKTASALFKPYFRRLRPCYEPAIQELVHTVGGCGGEYGFVSSHSANTFGLAMALWLLLRHEVRNVGYLFVWAFVVSYSRIYVGAHYPLDLIGGALVGMAYAWLVVALYQWLTHRYGSKSEINKNRTGLF
jgi:undecaprenyl-diphosphatase